jgi:hypothetical protein
MYTCAFVGLYVFAIVGQAFPFNFVQLHASDDGNTGQCYADFCNYGDIRMAQVLCWFLLCFAVEYVVVVWCVVFCCDVVGWGVFYCGFCFVLL